MSHYDNLRVTFLVERGFATSVCTVVNFGAASSIGGHRVIVLAVPEVLPVCWELWVDSFKERMVSQFVTNMPNTTETSVSAMLFPQFSTLTISQAH